MTGHHTTIRSRRPRSRWRRIAALSTVLAALFGSSVAAALPAVAANPSYVPISGSGSTWSFNAIDAWRKNVVQYAMTINYAQQGSTAGRNAFKSGTVDWAASDIPYGVQDGTNYDPPPDTRPFVYMPDTAGGTTFMYNLAIAGHRVTNLRLSGSTIAGIFTGTITNWSDQAIKQDNPGLTLPAIQIVPVVRSDGSGATAQFTQWLVATQGPLWNAYCAKVQRNPCTQTSAYPVSPGMVGQSGDLGVSGYVAQTGAAGAIGYVEYSYALNAGFPVAKVLNKAGYYTEPTPGHVAVSLLDAQINMNPDPKVYLTQNLSGVYTDPDARTYPLSSYSYMILPTTSVDKFNAVKGLTLGDFGKYLLCQGQNQVDQLGYSALPINLVQAGFSQLRKIPGANISNINIQSCNNPTFSTNGTNTLAVNDPLPAACDKAGPTQCTAGTGGAHGTSTPVNPGAGGSGGAGAGGAGAGAGAGTGAGAGAGATSAGAAASQAICDPDTGCTSAGGSLLSSDGQQIAGVPLASATSLGDGMQVTLMVLAAVLLVGLGLAPPLISQAIIRRRDRRGGAR